MRLSTFEEAFEAIDVDGFGQILPVGVVLDQVPVELSRSKPVEYPTFDDAQIVERAVGADGPTIAVGPIVGRDRKPVLVSDPARDKGDACQFSWHERGFGRIDLREGRHRPTVVGRPGFIATDHGDSTEA